MSVDHDAWSRSDKIALLALAVSAAALWKTFTADPLQDQIDYQPRVQVHIYETNQADGGRKLEVVLINRGKIPAKNVHIALMARKGVHFPGIRNITLDPISPNKIERDDDTVILRLIRTLGPNQRVVATMDNIKLDKEILGPCLDSRIYNDDEGESQIRSYERFEVIPEYYSPVPLVAPAYLAEPSSPEIPSAPAFPVEPVGSTDTAVPVAPVYRVSPVAPQVPAVRVAPAPAVPQAPVYHEAPTAP